MYKLTPERIAAPADTPVSVADAKANSRIDSADEDAFVTSLIEAATAHLDGWSGVLGRCLVTQTWRESFPCFPAGRRLHLGLAPAQMVTSLTYWSDGSQLTFDSASYRLQRDALSPYIELVAEAAWPGSDDRDDAVQMTYQAGYGTAASVPADLKRAILVMVDHWHRHRGVAVTGTIISRVPMAAESLFGPFRRVGF